MGTHPWSIKDRRFTNYAELSTYHISCRLMLMILPLLSFFPWASVLKCQISSSSSSRRLGPLHLSKMKPKFLLVSMPTRVPAQRIQDGATAAAVPAAVVDRTRHVPHVLVF